MSRWEQQLFEYFTLLDRKLQAMPLILGGAAGSGGGYGGRPGGFIGVLPQTQIAYDMSESSTNVTPGSGYTLVDNLNHIRYRLTILEGNITVLNSGVLVSSGVHTINFVGASVVNDGDGIVTVTFT